VQAFAEFARPRWINCEPEVNRRFFLNEFGAKFALPPAAGLCFNLGVVSGVLGLV
jgi:hypothetical protein